ncbi:MAG: hypothetical protein KC431_06810, partial [Myxococcales bacterium]|nr:hypothetical protein [Myxococcales bacterium]
AFYSALGDRGLDELIAKRHHFGFSVAIAWTDNRPFELLLTYLLQGLDLNDLEITVIASAARAADGETAYLSSSLAGQACMASGSLPPMVPTYVQNRRLLDGGLTRDVPTAVLTSAGAELIIGVQPIPRVNPQRTVPRKLLVPPALRKLAVVNYPGRMFDYYRAYLMLFRQAARSDEPNADVIYEATTKHSHASLFLQAKRVAEDAVGSPALERAVEDSAAEWRRMLLRPPGRIILEQDSGKFILGNSSVIPLEGRRHADSEWIPPHSRAIVHQIAEFVARHGHIDLQACLCVPEDESEAKIQRWLELLDQTLDGEDCLQRRFERDVRRDPEARRVYLELGVIPRA